MESSIFMGAIAIIVMGLLIVAAIFLYGMWEQRQIEKDLEKYFNIKKL